jgi:two-component system chemotaxis response regulator CheY
MGKCIQGHELTKSSNRKIVLTAVLSFPFRYFAICSFALLNNRSGKEAKMRILIVEDDFTSRLLLQGILKQYGQIDTAVNGREAVEATRGALTGGQPYDLICLDIMMPELDGHGALKEIRHLEEEAGIAGPNSVKVIMTSALADSKNIMGAFREQCDAYVNKPINKGKLIDHLRGLGLIT